MPLREPFEKKGQLLKFAEKMLAPGTLVQTTPGASEAYIFPKIHTDKMLRISGEGRALPSAEPLFIAGAYIGGDATYCYVVGRTTFGWLPTWEGDGVIDMIQCAPV